LSDDYAPAVRRLLLATPGLLLALALTGCGGNDDNADTSDEPSSSSTSSASSEPSSGSGGLTVTDGSTPDELVSCLTDAGLTAAATDTTMMGVDDPHVKVEVDDLEGYSGPGTQGADLWVFADPAAASKNASYITLGGSDDPTNPRFEVAGNVVLAFDIITAVEPTDDEAAVLSCLPT
jgi:hypothetical protein